MGKRTFGDVIDGLGARLDEFEALAVPVYVLDRHGVVLWTNRAAGDLLGSSVDDHPHFREFLAPEYRTEAREHFVRKMLGSETSSTYDVDVVDRAGRRRGANLSTVVLFGGGQVVGVFGVVDVRVSPHASPVPNVKLSPRQLEVLRHLEAGLATDDIAKRMGVSVDTVRNHIRAVLRALGVHSRLQAVVEARRQRRSD